MIVLLWLCLILLPMIIGMGVLAVFYRKKENYVITVSEGCVVGFIALLGIAEMAHIIGMFLDKTLIVTGVLWLSMLGGLAILALVAVAVLFRKNKARFTSLYKSVGEKTMAPFVWMVLLFAQIMFIFCMESIVTSGDITLETVQSFLAEDGIYRVMPLTGMVSETGLPFRYMILCLPTLYATLCRLFGMEAELVVCHVIPVVVLAMAYFSYYHLSGILFGKKVFKKRYLFLTAIAILLFMSNNGVFTNGYGAFYSGYLGTTIRNLILVPYCFAAALEGRWWKGLLCVLAEACIVWTFWGGGVCLAILVGMLIITILDKEFATVHKLLQIFRKEEDLS